MWEMVTNMWPRRQRRMNTFTAMVMGAGLGIAAWEIMRRSSNGSPARNDADFSKMASEVMDAVQKS